MDKTPPINDAFKKKHTDGINSKMRLRVQRQLCYSNFSRKISVLPLSSPTTADIIVRTSIPTTQCHLYSFFGWIMLQLPYTGAMGFSGFAPSKHYSRYKISISPPGAMPAPGQPDNIREKPAVTTTPPGYYDTAWFTTCVPVISCPFSDVIYVTPAACQLRIPAALT